MTRPTRRTFLASSLTTAAALPLLPAAVARAAEPEVLDVGDRLELMIDDYLIDRATAEARLHHPIPQEIAVEHDAPWEGNSSGYHSVFQDGDRYCLYHRGARHQRPDEKTPPRIVACYAESDDGIHWRKPDLGLVEFNGSKQNNIILDSGPRDDIAMPLDAGHQAFFRDENPDAPAESRYKALIRGRKGETFALFAFASPDAIHWKPMQYEPVLSDYGRFDSQNTAFWDPVLGQYRAYCRSGHGGIRSISTATSSDYLNWSKLDPLRFPGADPKEQLYTNAIKPYARAPHLLIGFPTRYIERGWSDSMRALPDLKNREARAKKMLRYGTALTEGLLMTSRDGRSFHRWDEAFLRPGPERPGAWYYGHQSIAWHLVQTRSALDPSIPELSLYAPERSWHGPGTQLRRYTLRLDGFVSRHAPMSGGELLTKPLTFSGNRLTLNFATGAAGAIRVELQDAAGKPIPGFTLADSNEVFGDAHARQATWKQSSDLSHFAGQPVRLRLELKDADLYALQFTA